MYHIVETVTDKFGNHKSSNVLNDKLFETIDDAIVYIEQSYDNYEWLSNLTNKQNRELLVRQISNRYFHESQPIIRQKQNETDDYLVVTIAKNKSK